MAPSAVTAIRNLGRSGFQTARRTACRCGRRVLAAALPDPRTPSLDGEGDKTRPSLEGRWSLAALPKASAPPNPLLPSEIKYSASLVRGQAVTHAVLGTLLFITGVLGTRHTGGGGTSSAGVWCGVSAIVCAVCGLMAHRLWYRNWAIKSFLLASTAAAVLCVLGLCITSYFAVLASHQPPYHHPPGSGYRYSDGRYGDAEKDKAGALVNGTAETSSEVKDMFFDLPPPPRTSQSLLGNLILGLCAELFVSVWSLVVAWKGVQAEEFTIGRREELVKEIIARAPASHALSRTTATVDAETNGSMPLAALYHLLQAHPELLTSKLQWGAECPHAAPSHASMDYRERVSRYLSNTLQAEEDIERNPSPSSITSLTKRQRSSSAPDVAHESPHPTAVTSRRRSRSKSEHRTKSKDRRWKPKEPEVAEGDYSSTTSSPMNSTTSPPETPSDSSPSSTLTRLESSDTSDTLELEVLVEDGGKQSQSLVLGLKTLSPLSSHVINPSEMMPCRKGKFATIQSKTTATVENEVAKQAPTMESDSEYNVSFVHTVDKPPPLPKKEYTKPTLVINEKLRQEAQYVNKEQVSTSSKSRVSARVGVNDTTAEKLHRRKLLEELADRNENAKASLSSRASAVSEKSITNTLLRNKKDKKPPPVPDQLQQVSKAEVPITAQHLQEIKNSTSRKEVEAKETEIDVGDRIYGNLSDESRDNTCTIAHTNLSNKSFTNTCTVADSNLSNKSRDNTCTIADTNLSNKSFTNTCTVADGNELYANVPEESAREEPENRKYSKNRSNKQRKPPLSIEIRPYETKTIVIKRDDRGKDSA